MDDHVARRHARVVSAVRTLDGREIQMDQKLFANRIHIDKGDVDVEWGLRSGLCEFPFGVRRNAVQHRENCRVQEGRDQQHGAKQGGPPKHPGRTLRDTGEAM